MSNSRASVLFAKKHPAIARFPRRFDVVLVVLKETHTRVVAVEPQRATHETKHT